METRKILISKGYGAGWTTWHSASKEEKLWMLTYEPWIAALEAGRVIDEHLQDQFTMDWSEAFPGRAVPCMLGVPGLEVCVVPGEVRIEEYDGAEYVVTREEDADLWF